MSSEPAFIRVLRESVEAALTGSVASAALFAALAAWGSRGARVPSSFSEVVELVRGPLREALASRVGAARAAELSRILEERLRIAELPTGTLQAPFAPEEATTTALPKVAGPVTISVIAATTTLATLIASVLGPSRVEAAFDGPAMLILDASDAPSSWGADLERRAHEAGATLVYGSDLPEGRSATSRLASARVGYLAFETEHGAAPILDLIRSRAG